MRRIGNTPLRIKQANCFVLEFFQNETGRFCSLIFTGGIFLIFILSLNFSVRAQSVYSSHSSANSSASAASLSGQNNSSDKNSGETSASAEPTRFILTHKGVLQEGSLVDRGESYFLRLPNNGGGLTISKLDVAFVGESREAVFNYLKGNISDKHPEEMIRLAEWSGRNQLAKEGIAYLKEKLAQTAVPQTRELLLNQIDKMEYIERLKNEADQRLADGTNRQTQGDVSERQRLENFGRQIPRSLLEKYTRQIQPLLLRRCATAECHAAESENPALTLDTPAHFDTLRTVNLRNLEKILDWVYFAQPASSPILNHPPLEGPDGERFYPFENDSKGVRDYKLFSEWVETLGNRMKNYRPDPNRPKPQTRSLADHKDRAAVPVDLTAPESTPANAVETPSGGWADSEGGEDRLDALFDGTAEDELSREELGEKDAEDWEIQLGSTSESRRYRKADPNSDEEVGKRLGKIPTAVPRDEFDPILFNRKYHPERDAADSSNVPEEN